MTTMTYTDRAAGGASIWQPLADLKARLAQHRTYRTTVRELSALSSRDLTDMGLHSADIHSIARQAAYGA